MASIKVLATGIFLILFVMDVLASTLSNPPASSSNAEKIGFSSSKKIRFQLESSVNRKCGCGRAQFGTWKRGDSLLLIRSRLIPQEIYAYDYNDEYNFDDARISFATAEIVGDTIIEVCLEVEGSDLYVFYSVEANRKVNITVKAYGVE